MGPLRRYPWGMRAWAFWILAVIALSLPGSIPYVGPVLFVAGLVWAFLWFHRLPREVDRRFRPYGPVPLIGQSPMILAPGQEVVGESHYTSAIGAAVARGGRILDAVIWWEPRNPHDGNALRVDLLVDGTAFTCGYLPRDVARSKVGQVKENADRGHSTIATARVYGGTADKPNYGVWLNDGGAPKQVRFE